MLNIKLRAYQKNIAETCKKANTLVVLPTGLGKTFIAFDLMLYFNQALFLAPTKPLVMQHYQSFLKYSDVDESQVSLVTGDIKKDRALYYKKPFVFATPQTVRNDLEKGIAPKKWHLVIFDEAHRGVGDYAYVKVAELVEAKRIIGLTASPGSTKQRIQDILKNLHINAVEVRIEEDEDVKPYIKKKNYIYIRVSLTPLMRQIRSLLLDINKESKAMLESYGIYVGSKKSDAFNIPQQIQKMQGNIKYALMVKYSLFLNTMHMLELLETQGINALKQYIESSIKEKKKAMLRLLRSKDFIKIRELIKEAEQEGEDHPKINKLLEILDKNKEKKGIIFSQYRNEVIHLVDIINKYGLKAKAFLGKKQGFNKKMQEQVIKDFRNNVFNILVASSIGEEGIDIPSVDFVIFYDAVPSAIRLIQRRGRAARVKEGFVYFLITRGTRDEGFYWASKRKERRMHAILYDLKKESEELLKALKRKKEVEEEKKEENENKEGYKESIKEKKLNDLDIKQKTLSEFLN